MTSLCHLASDWRGDLPPGGAMVEQKIDGFRCLWFRGIDGKPRLWTRQGHPIEGCDHIAHRLALFEEAAGGPLFIDGELQVDGSLAATKHWVETGWKHGGEKGVYHAFDVLADADWRAGGGDVPLYQRKAWLAALADQVGDPWEWRARSHGRDDPTAVRIIPDEWTESMADVIDLARRVWAVEGEGVVVKDALAPYRRKRSGAWAKVKQCNQHKWSRRPIAA